MGSIEQFIDIMSQINCSDTSNVDFSADVLYRALETIPRPDSQIDVTQNLDRKLHVKSKIKQPVQIFNSTIPSKDISLEIKQNSGKSGPDFYDTFSRLASEYSNTLIRNCKVAETKSQTSTTESKSQNADCRTIPQVNVISHVNVKTLQSEFGFEEKGTTDSTLTPVSNTSLDNSHPLAISISNHSQDENQPVLTNVVSSNSEVGKLKFHSDKIPNYNINGSCNENTPVVTVTLCQEESSLKAKPTTVESNSDVSNITIKEKHESKQNSIKKSQMSSYFREKKILGRSKAKKQSNISVQCNTQQTDKSASIFSTPVCDVNIELTKNQAKQLPFIPSVKKVGTLYANVCLDPNVQIDLTKTKETPPKMSNIETSVNSKPKRLKTILTKRASKISKAIDNIKPNPVNIKKRTKDGTITQIQKKRKLSNSKSPVQAPKITQTAPKPSTHINLDDENLTHLVESVISSQQLKDQYSKELSQIQHIFDLMTNTAQQIATNKDAISHFHTETSFLKEQQHSLQNTLADMKQLFEMKSHVGGLKDDQKQQKSNELEWAKIQAQIQTSQMEHDIKLNQIQSAIAIADIKAKSQAFNVNSQHEIGLGKLKLEQESINKNHEHQYRLLQIKSELDSQNERQKEWYISFEKDRERKFAKELEQSKNEQVTKLDHLEKEYRLFQENQQREHEFRMRERDENFQTNMHKLKMEHNFMIEGNKQNLAQTLEQSRYDYKKNITEMQQRFSCDLQQQRNTFEIELEDKRESSTVLLAKRRENMERYKADLMASIKSRQIEKQDENEKMKLQLKLDEYQLKSQEAISKNSTNKYQFKMIPQPTSFFEYQMEKSAETAPFSVIRTFDQLWNTMYETDMDLKRVLKYKRELSSVAKKAIDNYAAFHSYLSEDLEDSIITRRLNYCEHFNKVGMFLFKTGNNFNFTKHALKKKHIDIIHEIERKATGVSLPRYMLTEDGNYIVDLFEYIPKSVVFPINASYNLNVHEQYDISFKNQFFICPDIIHDVFKKQTIFRIYQENQVQSKFLTHDSTVKPRRSVPIYVSDNRIKITPLC